MGRRTLHFPAHSWLTAVSKVLLDVLVQVEEILLDLELLSNFNGKL